MAGTPKKKIITKISSALGQNLVNKRHFHTKSEFKNKETLQKKSYDLFTELEKSATFVDQEGNKVIHPLAITYGDDAINMAREHNLPTPQKDEGIAFANLTKNASFFDKVKNAVTTRIGQSSQYLVSWSKAFIVKRDDFKNERLHPLSETEYKQAHESNKAKQKQNNLEKKNAEKQTQNSENKHSDNTQNSQKNNNIDSNSTDSGE